MPTESHEGLLYRELSKAEAKGIIAIASPLLQEVINYSTHAWLRCNTSVHGKENEHLAVFMLYLHIIEMTDAIEVLVSQSCAVPALPLVRSTFEASLYVDYIFETPEDYTRRSLAWTADCVHSRQRTYEVLDETKPSGKLYKKFFKVPVSQASEVTKANERLERLLQGTEFAAIEAEYERSRAQSKSRRRPNWYSLWAGPKNLEELARHFNRDDHYEFLYRYWSRVAHAGDVARFIGRSAHATTGIKRLRNPEDIKGVTLNAVSSIIKATHGMLHKFRPEESMSTWYEREVRARYFQMMK